MTEVILRYYTVISNSAMILISQWLILQTLHSDQI